jgi:hypothetical protein
MTRKLARAIVLTVKGGLFLTLALVDWLAAKFNVSERGYLMPFSVAREFQAAITAAWHGQNRLPSLPACRNWKRSACGPVPH